MTAVMQAHDLARHYPLRGRPFAPPRLVRAVDGVSFTLRQGETLAVVGESGSGKSTLARMAALLETPDRGTIQLEGEDAGAASASVRRRLRRHVQMVFQNPYGSLNPRQTVGATLMEPLLINRIGNRQARETAAREMMAHVGLRPEHFSRYPHMFSGGQRQRIAIARALMLQPRVVIADEPVSALDVSIQAQVLNLLMDLRDAFRLATMFISHDLSVVRHIATEVLVLYLGCVVESAPAENLFAAPRHPYTRMLLAATPSVDAAHRRVRETVLGELPSPVDPPSGCVFSTRCRYVQDVCRRERPPLRPVAGHLAACHFAESIGEGG